MDISKRLTEESLKIKNKAGATINLPLLLNEDEYNQIMQHKEELKVLQHIPTFIVIPEHIGQLPTIVDNPIYKEIKC